ncbi:MAG: hypothetical protein ACJATN_001243 [Neolewinella sp.]|jgi:hypothetical protein
MPPLTKFSTPFVWSVCLFLLFFQHNVQAQIESYFQPVLKQMEELESTRDSKCYATASRLEDFIYGTPLSMEARDARIDFQQQLVLSIWSTYTNRLVQQKGCLPLECFQVVMDEYFQYGQLADKLSVSLPGAVVMEISNRDFRQYSTVPYALRAILAVQQSCYLGDKTLAPLNEELLSIFKKSIDIAVLAMLGQADIFARAANSPTIEKIHIDAARQSWKIATAEGDKGALVELSHQEIIDLVEAIIQEKLKAYEAYNTINQAVFMRNIQVYFSKVPWPKEQQGSDALKNHFTMIMVQFARELLLTTQEEALKQGANQLHYKQMYQSVQLFLPHTVNYFEDVTYFPKLGIKKSIAIEAYDLDAFRDIGLHWQYLRFVLQDYGTDIKLLPDPFALEIYVEGIAQFAVLLFRMAGEVAVTNEDAYLQTSHLDGALRKFQGKLVDHENQQVPEFVPPIIISADTDKAKPTTSFEDISATVGLDFTHRNSDWLSRLIRSYTVKADENIARLAIPPAFGGSGIAAEDVDGDGWVDVLLLGGRGNRLYKNMAGEKFVDITEKAGLVWQRADGTFGEARQPIIVDFDNDGYQDIFISYANDQHRIYRNLGDGTFEDLTQRANLGGDGLVAGPATVLDYDKDGLLDIYIGYFGNYLAGELPTLKRHNNNASPNKLFRNRGNFQFVDVSTGSGLENSGWTQALVHADIDGDGWQDLIVGNDFGVNAYYINQQDGTFIDQSVELGTSKPSYTMSIGVGDLNEDLHPDFYISNIVVMEKDDKYVLPNEEVTAHFDPKSLATMRVVEANDLFLSTNKEYVKSGAVDRGYAATGWSWDADFFDFDNDTDLDLYCLTGMNEYSVYGEDNPYYTTADGTQAAVTFATSNAEKNILFENDKGRLNTRPADPLAYEGTSRSAAYFDFDKDGDLDVVVNDYQGKARLFRNNTAKDNHWTSLQLTTDAKQGNRDAIGAVAIVTLPNGQQLWRGIHSTTGYLSAHPKAVHFGLGNATEFDLEVRWPNGEVANFKALAVDKAHYVSQ